MKKQSTKRQPYAVFSVYADGKLVERARVKAYHGPAPDSAKRPSRKRRKSA
jgi:hypothetical protein